MKNAKKNANWIEPPQSVPMRELTAEHTFAEAVYSFLDNNDKIRQLERAGSRYIRDPFLAMARSELGPRKVKDIDRRELHFWKCETLEAGKAGGTLNGKISKIRKVYAWLVSLQIVDENPCKGLERVATTEPKRRTRAIDAAEIEQIAAAVETYSRYRGKFKEYGNCWRLMAETGLRAQEAIDIRAKHLERGKICTLIVPKAKGRIEARVVLSRRALEILEKVIGDEGPEFQPFAFHRSALYSALQRCFKRGITKEAFPHLARHTALTNYAGKTASIKEMMTFGRHKSLKSVSKYIMHDVEEMQLIIHGKLNG